MLAAPARRPRIALWAAAGVILVLAGALALRRPKPVATGSHHAVVAVLPFTIHGPAAELRDGMVELLSTNLDGAGDLRAVDPHAVLSVVSPTGTITPVAAGSVARRFDAQYYVLGDVTQAGSQLQIDASLYDGVRGVAVARATTRGNADSLLVLVDRIAMQLVSARGLAPGELTQLAAYTTHSYPALKHYLEGESAYRAAQYHAATSSFIAAVQEDPKFALADYRLSAAGEWDFDFGLAHRSAQRALNNSERLTDQYQQLVSAWWHFLNGNAATAQRAYERVLNNHPDNVEALSGLGEVFAHFNAVRGEPESAARAAFDRVLTIAPAYGEVRFHVLEFTARDRNLARFDSLLAGLDASNQQYLAWHAVRAFVWGNAADQRAIVQRVQRRDEFIIGLAAARLAQTGNFTGAEIVTRGLLQPNRTSEWRAGGQLLLAELLLARGRWQDAQNQIAAARRNEPDWPMELEALFLLHPAAESKRADFERMRAELLAWDPNAHSPSLSFFLAVHATVHNQLRLYLLGLMETQLGELANAERYRRELERSEGDPEARKFASALSTSLAGHMARVRGDKAKALEQLSSVTIAAPPEFVALSPFYSRAYDRYVMAELNRELGRNQEARRWYTSLLSGYDFAYGEAARSRLSSLNPQ